MAKFAWTYKTKFRLALAVCSALALTILIVVIVSWRRQRSDSQAGSQANVPTVIVVKENPEFLNKKAPQATWEYKPSDNPRYENNTSIQQIGFMTSTPDPANPTTDPKILPLFGQSLREKHSDRWAYFTATDQQQSIRIPVEFESRDCMNDDVGCRELFASDVVKVPSFNDQEFKVSLYKNKLPHV